MEKNINSVDLYKSLPCNFMGRDLVVGDLHGSVHLLERFLDSINFDPSVDRVLSVGDLGDRGASSLGTLRLLREPWFHAVISNHESMLLTYLERWRARAHTAYDFLRNGGQWVEKIDPGSSDWSDLMGLVDLVEDLPLALVVEGDGDIPPFNVTHADLTDLDMSQKSLTSSPRIDRSLADQSVWSRTLLYQANVSAEKSARFDYQGDAVLISDAPLEKGLHLTYVGHNILKMMLVHRSHIFIDRGAYRAEASPADFKLQVVDHRSFAAALSQVLYPKKPRRAPARKKVKEN